MQSDVPRLEEVLRWHGEPVKALLLPTSAFLTNRRGYPTLSKAHQELLTRFFQMGVQASGASWHQYLMPTCDESHSMRGPESFEPLSSIKQLMHMAQHRASLSNEGH